MSDVSPSEPLTTTTKCPKCGREVELLDRFCKHCGGRLGQGETMMYHPIMIFVLAFTVLGPFAIPMVWKSTQMNRAAKHAMTWLIMAYFVLVLVVGYFLIKFMFGLIAQINGFA